MLIRSLSLLLSAFLLLSCHNASEGNFVRESMPEAAYDDADYEESYEEQPAKPADVDEAIPTENTPRRIIKTGRIEMQVDDVASSTRTIEALAETHQGYITQQETVSSNYRKGTNLVLRVDATAFDQAMADILAEGLHVNRQTVEAKDVTEEFVDIEIRLQTKKDVRDRYIDILRNKAKTVEEVLLAEEQIRKIQEEIESAEGRLKYLRSQTSMSTIYVDLYQEVDYEPTPPSLRDSFWKRFGRGLANGWTGIGEFFVAMANLWPLVLVMIALLIWLRRRGGIWRRKKND